MSQLILNLSTGALRSTQIQAVNLDGLDWTGNYAHPAVVLWRKDTKKPLYFQHGSADAEAIASWADTQLSEQFLRLSSLLFAADAVAIAFEDGDDVVVILKDHAQFVACNDPFAAQSLRIWNGEATLQHVAAIA